MTGFFFYVSKIANTLCADEIRGTGTMSRRLARNDYLWERNAFCTDYRKDCPRPSRARKALVRCGLRARKNSIARGFYRFDFKTCTIVHDSSSAPSRLRTILCAVLRCRFSKFSRSKCLGKFKIREDVGVCFRARIQTAEFNQKRGGFTHVGSYVCRM